MKTTLSRLAVAGVLVGTLLPAMVAAQPSSNLDDYALFAETKFRTKGISLACGGIGVNQETGKLLAPRFITVPGQVVSNFAKIGENAAIGQVFANIFRIKAPITPTPWTPPILTTDLETACGYPTPFPACDPNEDVLVEKGTTGSLGPGTYGDLNLKGGFTELGSADGAILELTGGDYSFCNVKLNKFSEVRALAPVTVHVNGNFRMQATNQWGGAAGSGVLASQIVVYVAGRKVHYSRGSQVTATLCAPFAKCRLTKGGAHTGQVACENVRTEEITFNCSASPSGAFLD